MSCECIVAKPPQRFECLHNFADLTPLRRDHKERESNNKQVVARRAKNKREITLSLFRSYLSLFLLCAQHPPPDCYCRADAVKDKRSEVNHTYLLLVFKYVIMEDDRHIITCIFLKNETFSIYLIIADLLNKFQPQLTKGLRTFVPLHFIGRTEHPNPSPPIISAEKQAQL